jgi:inorganic triphosphatase YgiF
MILVNHYFDTPGRALRAVGAMLRVRESEEAPPVVCLK